MLGNRYSCKNLYNIFITKMLLSFPRIIRISCMLYVDFLNFLDFCHRLIYFSCHKRFLDLPPCKATKPQHQILQSTPFACYTNSQFPSQSVYLYRAPLAFYICMSISLLILRLLSQANKKHIFDKYILRERL